MNARSILDHLSTTFAVLGAIAIVASLGGYLVIGQIDKWVILLFAIGLGCLVYAALERPERTVEALSSRNVRYGSNTVVMSVAFIGILALINVLSNRYNNTIDLTQNHNYTLSPLSVQIVHKLTQPVEAYAFYQSGDPARDSFKPLLEEYRKESSLINYQFVDPYSQPGMAHQYNVQAVETTVLVSGTKQQTITGSDEGAFTTALLKLERTTTPVIYYLTGHGELDFANTDPQQGASLAKTAIEADDYVLKPLNLAATTKVPSDAAAVIVAGPTVALLPLETTALEQYLDSGGKALVLADKRQQSILGPFAQHYGVDLGNGIVVDPALNFDNDELTPLIGRQANLPSPITKDLPSVILPSATSATPATTPPKDLQVQPLAQTTDQSWLETDPKVAHYDPGVDPKGPLDVLVSVTRTPTDTTTASSNSSTRVVFVGDVVFAMNTMAQIGGGDLPLGNKVLLTNAINWLTANDDLIQIQAKPATDQSLILSNTQVNVLLFGSAVFLPLIVLAAGALVWWNRR